MAEFRRQVLKHTEGSVTEFDIMRVEAVRGDQSDIDELPLSELKSQKFRMRVNKRTYDVYPDFRSITDKGAMTKVETLGT